MSEFEIPDESSEPSLRVYDFNYICYTTSDLSLL